MKMFTCTIFLISVATTNGLKLLVDNEQQSDLLEDDDDVWETDIQFSYKPHKGKCTGVATTDNTESFHPSSNGKSYSGPGDPGGVMSNAVCVRADYPLVAPKNLPNSFDKYCKAAPSYNAGAASSSTFVFITGQWHMTASSNPKWKLSKYVHYLAKLATMSNAKLKTMKCTNASTACSQLILSFDVGKNYANVQYKEAASAGNNEADFFCYSAEGMMWAKNDPKVKNMDGQEFEIMATGIFSMLKLQNPSKEVLLDATATIDRAGSRCGATYIQNITLEGTWVSDVGVPKIEFQAKPTVPKTKALEVNFGEGWQPANAEWSYKAVEEATAAKFVVKLNTIKIEVAIDSHRIHSHSKVSSTKRFANFLNLNFRGISGLAGVAIGGLLGRDSHDDAVKLPDGCTSKTAKLSVGASDLAMFSSVNIA